MYDGNIYVNTLDKTMKSLKLKPERKNAWEIGLDLRLFDSRLNFDVTYYKEIRGIRLCRLKFLLFRVSTLS